MSTVIPIGGYLELESLNQDFPYSQSILLNTGRNCFEYILKATGCTHVYLPTYTCAVMLEPLIRHGISYSFYAIDENLEIKDAIVPGRDEYIVYTNYFGLKDEYARQLNAIYKDKLILDCSQAFYSSPLEDGHTFYSPRKFFALPDGACLITPVRLDEELPIDLSYDRMVNLLRRIDLGAEEDFDAYQSATPALKNQPIKQMSRLTRHLMRNIDYDSVREGRLKNFLHLHAGLKDTNELPIKVAQVQGPLLYPYLTRNAEELRQKLFENKVLFARYWRNVLEWSKEGDLEYYLAKNILPLPINQNHSVDDMQRMIDIIKS